MSVPAWKEPSVQPNSPVIGPAKTPRTKAGSAEMPSITPAAAATTTFQ